MHKIATWNYTYEQRFFNSILQPKKMFNNDRIRSDRKWPKVRSRIKILTSPFIQYIYRLIRFFWKRSFFFQDFYRKLRTISRHVECRGEFPYVLEILTFFPNVLKFFKFSFSKAMLDIIRIFNSWNFTMLLHIRWYSQNAVFEYVAKIRVKVCNILKQSDGLRLTRIILIHTSRK